MNKLSNLKIPKNVAILAVVIGFVFVSVYFVLLFIPTEAIISVASITSIGGSHPLGICAFIGMNVYAAYRFARLAKLNPNSSIGEKILAKVIAVGAGMSVAHSFFYMCDMCSIPTFIVREGIEVLPRISYLGWIWNHDLGFMRSMGFQLVVLYAYRKFINWKSLIAIIPLMLTLAFYTYFLFSFTGMHPLVGETRALFFLFSYIPTWIIFYWAFARFLR
jgi:hypothetical protein